MASINFGFFDNWFTKPPNPIPLLNLSAVAQLLPPNSWAAPNFASLSSSLDPKKPPAGGEEPGKKDGGEDNIYSQVVDQFFWECENLPGYRHTLEVEKILNEDTVFETKENPTEEEVRENERWWEEFWSSPVVKFAMRAEEIADMVNELELQENAESYRDEDKKLWQGVSHVPGLDGRPMPRKAIKTKKESDDKFWDFAGQFFFGLWALALDTGLPLNFKFLLEICVAEAK